MIGYPWTWVTDKQYKRDSSYHIVSLCDLVSRGGILLLSLTPKGDGSIPAEEVRIMRDIGDWLKVAREPVQMTQLEMKLLRYFVRNEGRVVPRRELLENVWDMPGYSTTRAPDQFIRRLR